MARKRKAEVAPVASPVDVAEGPPPIPPDTRPQEPPPKKRTPKFVRVIDGFTVTDWN